MATDMGRGIVAPENTDFIDTGAAEMRTLALTAVAALNDIENNQETKRQQFETSMRQELPWRGRIPDGTDIDTVREPGVHAVASQSAAFTMQNLPFPVSGLLLVWQTPGTYIWEQQFIGSGSGGFPEKATRITRSSSAWSGPWVFDATTKGMLPVGTSLSAFREPGDHLIVATQASDFPDLPEGLTYPLHAVLHVAAASNTIPPVGSQRLSVYEDQGQYRVFERVASVTTGFPAWMELTNQTSDGTDTMRDAGPYRHLDLVTRARHRRGGTIHTGKATVALRFDHHLDPFMGKVLPLLKKYSLPWAQIVNPNRVGSYPTDQNTTWEQLQQTCLDTGGEVWNHGATHADATTEQGLRNEIVNSLRDLQENLPELPIEGWTPPGLGEGAYMGAAPFRTTEQNTTTTAGQLIIGHHAFIAGYSNELYRVLDGVPPIGANHWTVDSSTPDQISQVLDHAEERDAGIAFMLHPNMLDATDRITTADFETILADIAARRDAGSIEVVSYSGLWLSSATQGQRHDIAPKAERSMSRSVDADSTYSAMIQSYGRNHLLGAPREIRIILDASAEGTLDLALTDRSTTTHTLTPGVNVIRRPITLGITSGNLSITVSPTVDATVTGLNVYAI